MKKVKEAAQVVPSQCQFGSLLQDTTGQAVGERNSSSSKGVG